MTDSNAFIDESLRSHFPLCAVAISANEIDPTRRELQRLRMAGQRRVHMVDESDRRRRSILSALLTLPVRARLYSVPVAGRTQRKARDLALAAATTAMATDQVQAVKIESCGQDRQDREVIQKILRELGCASMVYRHESAYGDAMLWVPDVVAWAYGRGGDWRRRVAPVVVAVDDL